MGSDDAEEVLPIAGCYFAVGGRGRMNGVKSAFPKAVTYACVLIMSDKSLAGHFLVASRYLRDPNFVQSVVLMIHHDHEGAMGVVINRPPDTSVREVWEIIGDDPCDRDDLIYVGGPVPGPLVALHNVAALGNHQVLPGLLVSTKRDALDRIVRKKNVPLRLCSGN